MTEEKRPSLIKLNSFLFRYTQSYTDKALERFGLTSGTYPFILILNEKEGINQNQISEILNVDKSMSARAIKKLIELGYVEKVQDEKDVRAYKLYLTNKARAIVPEILEELYKWIDIITDNFSEEEKESIIYLMNKALLNIEKYKSNL